MRPIDHAARGDVIPLRDFVRDRRDRASAAAWSGDAEIARRLDREADAAIEAGEDPVPMF